VKDKAKEKVNFLQAIQGEVSTKDFELGPFIITVRVPTVFDEAKVVLKRYDLLKFLLDLDEDLAEYVKRFKVKTFVDGEVKEVDPDLNNQSHLEEIYQKIDPRFQDIILRLAFLKTITVSIKDRQTGEEIEDFSIEKLLISPALGVHITDMTNLVDTIFVWLDSMSVDPLFRKEVN
jgi:hypothetical protein